MTQPTLFDRRKATLVDVLSEPLLKPADQVTCDRCGQEYRANGSGHITHMQQCPGRTK
jgi:hypothetical protein